MGERERQRERERERERERGRLLHGVPYVAVFCDRLVEGLRVQVWGFRFDV
jgi:hypothetical protein